MVGIIMPHVLKYRLNNQGTSLIIIYKLKEHVYNVNQILDSAAEIPEAEMVEWNRTQWCISYTMQWNVQFVIVGAFTKL